MTRKLSSADAYDMREVLLAVMRIAVDVTLVEQLPQHERLDRRVSLRIPLRSHELDTTLSRWGIEPIQGEFAYLNATPDAVNAVEPHSKEAQQQQETRRKAAVALSLLLDDEGSPISKALADYLLLLERALPHP